LRDRALLPERLATDGDRLFALFSLAFWAFAANRVAITTVDDTGEAEPYIHLIRLLAVGRIIAAIIDKNRAAPARAGVSSSRAA
jgi:hypothetical protein